MFEMELKLKVIFGEWSRLKTVTLIFTEQALSKHIKKEEPDSSSYELNSLPVTFVEQQLLEKLSV